MDSQQITTPLNCGFFYVQNTPALIWCEYSRLEKAMSDIIPNVVVSMPSQLFTLARKFQAASNGRIFIGKIDTDPTLPENQIQVYLENEDGSHIPVPQPLIINQAGFPVYNGQIAKFVTVEGHSMAVYDSYGAQQHYYPNVLKYDPDQFRQELAGTSGTDYIGYGDGTLTDYLQDTKKYQAKTIINVSAFGNTGTEQNGSDEAWNNAFSYALSIAPKWKNNYPAPQEWYDFSGFEFVADGNIYPKTSIGLRCTYGGTINLSVVAPDDHTGDYLIDMSVDRGVIPNRNSKYTRFMGAVNCRYKCSGINLGGSASTTTEHMRVDQFLIYGIDTDRSDTQTSGSHTIGIGTVVEQRSWSSGGDADFPPEVATGTGIYIRSHDNRIVGATVSYCKVRCVRIKGRSNSLVAGTHLYSAGKQALLHEEPSGNTLIDSCWLDSSRLQLEGGYITITNNLIYLTQDTDSVIGIITGKGASNILIKNNSFLGYVGGTPVYFSKGPLGDKTVVCYGNRYLPGMNNTDVITTRVPILVGESTAGTVSLDPSSGFAITYDGVYVNFTATIRWSSFTGGTGAIGIYGLPFVADRITPMNIVQFTNNDLFKGVSPIKHTSGTSLRLVKQDGTDVMASDAGVDSGYLCISGSYRPF